MIRILRQAVKRFITGIGFGSIVYLLVLAFIPQEINVSLLTVLGVFLFSGLMGEGSFLMDTDLPFLITLGLHFILMFILFLMMLLVCHLPIATWTIVLFLVTYIIIWLVILMLQEQQVRRINYRLKKRQSK